MIWNKSRKYSVANHFIPFSNQVPYPVHKVVENPKPIELEQVHPVDVQRPLKYTETVNIPVTDGNGVASNLNTNVNGNTENAATNPESNNGYQDLSVGYESHKIQKKAWIVHIFLLVAINCANKMWNDQVLPLDCCLISF